MGRVHANNSSLLFAIEGSLGVAGTQWFTLEPNEISSYGASVTTVKRSPISKRRSNRKGTATDQDSPVEFSHDLTMDVAHKFMEGYAFSVAVNANMDIGVSAVDGTGDAFTCAALTAAQAAKLDFSAGEYATLVYARGFSAVSSVNGLHALDTAAATSDTAIAVSTNLAEVTSPASNARIELAGVRFLAGLTDVVVAYSAGQATVTVANIAGFNWATLGLTLGQTIHVGGATNAGAVQNALTGSGSNDTYGFGRILAMTALVLTLDKTSTTLQVAAPTTPAVLDVLFGKFIRDVPVDHADYMERSVQFELSYPNLGAGGATEYEYAQGNYSNTVALNLPLSDKAIATFNFMGTTTEAPSATRKAGASAALAPLGTAALNTSADILRLRVTDVDETGLTTDFKSLTLNLGNNASGEKVLGTIGSKYINVGKFDVGLEASILFTDSAVIHRILDVTTVSMDFILQNEDGAVVVDFPSGTLSGGGREFPANETVKASLTFESFEDETFGTSIGVSFFPLAPAAD
jgi:hypothetical protein